MGQAVTKDLILHDSTYMKYPGKFTETEQKSVVGRSYGEGKLRNDC